MECHDTLVVAQRTFQQGGMIYMYYSWRLDHGSIINLSQIESPLLHHSRPTIHIARIAAPVDEDLNTGRSGFHL